MEFWQIVVGVVTAAFLIFLRNAHIKAQRQKVIAIRLRSYLLYWKGFVLDNDLFGIFHMGIEWNEEIDELVKNGGGAEELVDLKNRKKKELEKLKEKIIEESGKVSLNKEDIEKILKKLPTDTAEQILQYAQRVEQNLIDGKTFLSDEDASNLGAYVSQTAIDLKMNLISMINSGMGILAILISKPNEFELKDYADEIIKLVWRGIVVSKHIDILSKKVEFFVDQSTYDLTIRNIKDEL